MKSSAQLNDYVQDYIITCIIKSIAIGVQKTIITKKISHYNEGYTHKDQASNHETPDIVFLKVISF